MRVHLSDNKRDGLIFDLEVAPRIVGVYGPRHEPKEVYQVRREVLVSLAYKWASEDTTYYLDLRDSSSYNLDPHNDKELTRALFDLWQHADWGCAYNGDRFDIRVAKTYFGHHRLIPKDLRSIDPLKIARKEFYLPSYKMDEVATFLGVKNKVGINLTQEIRKAVEENDHIAWEKIERYNIQDVDTLEEIWHKIRAYATTHINLAVNADEYDACPRCMMTGTVKRKGTRRTNTRTYRRYRCKPTLGGCGAWFRGRKSLDSIQPRYV